MYRKLVVILGVAIDNLDMPETLDRLAEMVRIGRSTGKSHQIVTVNADFIVKAQQDAELRTLLLEADLATADGMPLVWGARLLNVPLSGRVTGADLIPALAQRASQEGFSLFLLGAAQGVAQQASVMLRERYPGLKIVGVKSPTISSIEATDPGLLAEIRAAKPDILLVALGNPKQEKWIKRYAAELKVPVMMGVGASLDFIAGKVRRAPRWMQQTGLEWMYRLLQEPGRLWQRYAVDLTVFSSAFARQLLVMRRSQHLPPTLPATDMLLIEDTAIINVVGELTVYNNETFNRWSRLALDLSPYIIVNLEKASFLDSSAIGMLVGLAQQVKNAGGQLWLAEPSPAVESTLKMLHLTTFFNIRPTFHDCLIERRAYTGGVTSSISLSGI